MSAMLLGSLSCYLLNFKKFQGMDLRKILGSLNNGITSIGSLSAVCGFGAVVQGSVAYSNIVEGVTSWEMSPYLLAVVATAVLAGVAGSSSGGARLMLSSMSDYFLSTGADMQILHRLIAIPPEVWTPYRTPLEFSCSTTIWELHTRIFTGIASGRLSFRPRSSHWSVPVSSQ